MKRSDAENLINNWLDTTQEITGRTIIDFVQEHLGMLPPPIETKHWNRQDNCYYEDNEWEQE